MPAVHADYRLGCARPGFWLGEVFIDGPRPCGARPGNRAAKSDQSTNEAGRRLDSAARCSASRRWRSTTGMTPPSPRSSPAASGMILRRRPLSGMRMTIIIRGGDMASTKRLACGEDAGADTAVRSFPWKLSIDRRRVIARPPLTLVSAICRRYRGRRRRDVAGGSDLDAGIDGPDASPARRRFWPPPGD